jgi:GNAT superfamily N-acetyltransferase
LTLAEFTPEMQIRPLTEPDLADLLELYSHLHETDAALPAHSVVDSVWTELLSSPNYRYFGSFFDGQLVSSCTLTIIPNLTRSCRPYGVVENVVTHSAHRRKGYATLLLRRALVDAWESGCYKVMLLTGRKDESTYKFYEQAGFDRHAKQAFLAKSPE